MKKFNPHFGFVTVAILVAAMSRLIPHWPNFTAVAAIALFGGAMFSKKYLSFVIPMIALLISDIVIYTLVLHTAPDATMLAVYGAFAITVMIGILIGRKLSVVNIIGGALGASVIFFIITNLASWLVMPFYPKTGEGLAMAFTAGLAFFNDGSQGVSFFLNDVIATLVFSAALFGSYALAKVRFPQLAKN